MHGLPQLAAITGACLCPYTSHGHCGVLADGRIDVLDATLQALGRMAVVHADAGADAIVTYWAEHSTLVPGERRVSAQPVWARPLGRAPALVRDRRRDRPTG